jgi:hypothetical protein
MFDQESYTASTHSAFITDILENIYDNDMENVQYLVADNTETMPIYWLR